MTLFRWLSLALAATALASCASSRAQQALDARADLIGLPREALFTCAGVPDRSRVDGFTEFATYQSEEFYGGSSVGVGFGTGFGRHSHTGVGVGFGYPLSTEFRSRYCEATFVIVSGVVTDVRYNAVSGYGTSRYGQCYNIVESCIAQFAPAPAG